MQPSPIPVSTRPDRRSLLSVRLHALAVLCLALLSASTAVAASDASNADWLRLADYPSPAVEAALSTGPAAYRQPLPLPRLAREEALEAATAYLRKGKQLAEESRFAPARTELNRALNILLESKIDFAADPAARRELENLIQEIHRLEVTRMGIGERSPSAGYERPPMEDIPELTFPVDPSLEATALNLVRARSSEFPLEVNENVLSYVRFFVSERGRRTFLAGYRRSGRYRDMISAFWMKKAYRGNCCTWRKRKVVFTPAPCRGPRRADCGSL